MKLSVHHVTAYTYEAPQRAVMQSQRLTPSLCENQTTLDWSIETEGALRGSVFRDGAGDETWLVRVPGPLDRVTVTVTGTVETRDFAGLLRGHREKVAPLVYLRGSRVTRPDAAIADLAQTAIAPVTGEGALAQAHALSAAVATAIVYTPDATHALTTAPEALASGRGVCQDHTHVLIAAARSLGMPARYVAGYLYAGGEAEGDEALLVGAQATHAWAELHVDGLGWVGFDAANGCCPDAHYIRLSSGLDADDAAPIRGLSAGTGGETLDVAVSVAMAQQ